MNNSKTKQDLDFEKYLNTTSLKITDKIKEPPICLSIIKNNKASIFGTLGNFSVIAGKPKSRKTFFVSAIVGAVLKGSSYMNIKPTFPKEKRKVIYIDTEQSKFHARLVMERVFKIANISTEKHPDNFQYYTIKRFPPDLKLRLIDYLINKEDDLGLVIIDGIRDVVTSINDEREATKVATYLMKWVDEKNIHIVTVLHQNKADNNIRGHLGSELENKAESIINIKKIPEHDDFSSIEAKNMRDVSFDTYSFGINDDNILYEVDNPEMGNPVSKPKYNEYTDQQYINIVRHVFKDRDKMRYSEVWQGIKGFAAVGDVKSKDILKLLTSEKNMITYHEVHKNYSSNTDEKLFE